MFLDHIVVHVDDNLPRLLDLSRQTIKAGIPFDPKKGKGTRGFKATNIWIGNQYFEITWLKKPSGGGWKQEWVDLYNNGHRGACCLFLNVRNISSLKKQLEELGVPTKEERVSFKVLGLLKKTMPWVSLYVPPIGNSNLQISFIEYEDKALERLISHVSPNAKEFGVYAMNEAHITIPTLSSSLPMLRKLFPAAKMISGRFEVDLDPGRLVLEEGGELKVNLKAKTNSPIYKGTGFHLEDICLSVD